MLNLEVQSARKPVVERCWLNVASSNNGKFIVVHVLRLFRGVYWHTVVIYGEYGGKEETANALGCDEVDESVKGSGKGERGAEVPDVVE